MVSERRMLLEGSNSITVLQLEKSFPMIRPARLSHFTVLADKGSSLRETIGYGYN